MACSGDGTSHSRKHLHTTIKGVLGPKPVGYFLLQGSVKNIHVPNIVISYSMIMPGQKIRTYL